MFVVAMLLIVLCGIVIFFMIRQIMGNWFYYILDSDYRAGVRREIASWDDKD